MQLPISNASQSWPPAPSSCRPYSSLQMFANMADGSGDNGLLGAQGHPRPTTSAGFPGMSILGRANQQRLDHASTSLPHNPIKRMEKSERKRGKAIRPPSLHQRGPPEQKIEECVLKAAGGEQVVNLDISVHLPRPKTGELKVNIPYLLCEGCMTLFASTWGFLPRLFGIFVHKTVSEWFLEHWIFSTTILIFLSLPQSLIFSVTSFKSSEQSITFLLF